MWPTGINDFVGSDLEACDTTLFLLATGCGRNRGTSGYSAAVLPSECFIQFSLSVKSSGLGSAFNLSCLTQNCQEILQNEHASRVNQDLSSADGIVMMVVNEMSGSVLLRKTFNTWNVFTHPGLVWWVKPSRRRIVVMTVPRAGTHGTYQRSLTWTFIYRKAWSTGITTFTSLQYIAFLDEDVEVSRDWLETLSHFAPALDTDPSLWCVSGSAPGHRYVFPYPQIFHRGFRQPGWGYLFSMAEARSMVAKWPASSSVSLLYDNFLYSVMSRGRECIFPALSRSHHYGVGVNTVPEIHQLYFLDQPLHSGERVHLPPVEELTQKGYESRVKFSLESAIPITRNPCAPGFLIPPGTHESKHFVFYFFMEDPNDSPEWPTLAECIGAWPYSTQSHHHGCFEIPQPWGGSMWLVGVPYSRYRYLRPPSVPIWQIKSQQELDSATAFSNALRIPPKVNRTLALAFTDLFIKS
ncbi:protein O-linked-mannose beta-1,2-N-acetylglucosaminyltransferase 1-like [Penaeus monodon]|uniref:protein O-linked-mannose beta-1,2-N-acetylglucosaminyltransferase 1-like n=1 Tax=Penaeus monodon TaxID=6687 RepID=UPI0018A7936B|nr:protein O-linked-mannose beta-1,2-N-acetylglucosaminyltransferase 1-like [Penaeus monodon]